MRRISSAYHRTVAGSRSTLWNPAAGKCTLASFPSFTDKRQVSRDGGGQPLWRSDGKELFYLSLQGKLMAVDTKTRSYL